MHYPNAEKGIRKIFVAEILGLCGAIALTITVVLGLLVEVDDILAIPAILCGVAAVVLMLLSHIFNIVGITRASKDEYTFRYALYAVIFGIFFSLLSGFLNDVFDGNEYAQRLISLIPDLVNLITMVFIVMGIRNMATALNDPVMESKGRNILTIAFVMEMIIFAARAFSGFIPEGSDLAIIELIVVGFAGMLSIVTYILYLSYLAKARRMLAA